MDLIVIRSPLVCGKKGKGNFLTLIRSLNRCIPPPFKAAQNLRSYVGVSNLVDLIVVFIFSPFARNETFLVFGWG